MASEKVLEEAELLESFVLLHETQLNSCALPEILWPSLFNKLRDEIFDAGNYFQICQIVDEDDELLGYKAICANPDGLSDTDPNGVFLIDHAWTYRLNEARQGLSENEKLLKRMCQLMNLKLELDEDKEKKIEAVLENMWKFNQTYKLSTEKLSDDEREPIWYIMDEFGSSIRHNDAPSVKCSPFFYLPTRTMFTILWPIKHLNSGDEVTRDFAYGVKDEKLRMCKLIPWNEDFDVEELGEENPHVQPEPGIEYFMSGRIGETLPTEIDMKKIASCSLSSKNKLNVYTDLEAVRAHLNDERYHLVDEMDNADILFVHKHFKDYKSLYEKTPHRLINQFPYENVVTIKDLLAIVSRRSEASKKWLPITYNLSYELPKFVAYYKKREEEELDNYWILKPWNLARSIDTSISNNLNQIIRSQETGPKIACKYISNPVLFYRDEVQGRVKFDLRYIILLRSVEPLVLYSYKVFWLRFANQPYSLDHFDEYEKHFTVMNYRPINLKQIHYGEFIPEFEKQNPDFRWSDIQEKIFKLIREVFEGARKEKPPKGIANNPQSRAMYGIDLMLDWQTDESGAKTIEPMLCEVNFMPDCTRACKYHPNFFNHVFNTLFLDDIENSNVHVI